MKLNSKQLRAIDEQAVLNAKEALPRKELYLILENIYA